MIISLISTMCKINIIVFILIIIMLIIKIIKDFILKKKEAFKLKEKERIDSLIYNKDRRARWK